MKKEKTGREKVKTGICDYLISFDCPSEYVGFPILLDLLKTALENFTEMAANLKSIYYRVATRRKITRLCIERNLTTLLDRWSEKEKFKLIFDKRPTNATALNILANKLRYLNCSVYDTLLMP